jgi:hypothetical protein
MLLDNALIGGVALDFHSCMKASQLLMYTVLQGMTLCTSCNCLLTLCVLGPLPRVVCVHGPDVNLAGHLARQVCCQV